MTSIASCPTCGQSGRMASLPNNKGKCPACGDVFDMPAIPPAVCFVCGSNLSAQKATKDKRGNYYCGPCWSIAGAQQQAAETAPGAGSAIQDPPARGYACSICHRLFTGDQVYSQNDVFICHECFAAQSHDRTDVSGEAVKCPRCSSQISEGHHFCPRCGTAIVFVPIRSTAPVQETERYQCNSCLGHFPADGGYNCDGVFVCRGCYAAGAKSSFDCPNCGSNQAQKLSVIYESGTHGISTQSTHIAFTGPSAVYGTTSTTGVQRSVLAERLKPPVLKSSVGPGCLGLVIGLGVGACGFALGMASNSPQSELLALLLGGLPFLFCLIVGLMASAAKGQRYRTEYARYRRKWEDQLMCTRCGHVFSPVR